MSLTGKRGENGVVVMLKAEAMEKAFEPYADGTNDIELFEAGFNAGVEWLATQMCKSLELGFKETIDKMVIPEKNEEARGNRVLQHSRTN